jgi:hypothetical protein
LDRGEEKMSILSKLASVQGRNDDGPNKGLGRELVETNEADGIRKIAENLWNEDKKIQADCLSVLEQVGLLAPELIEDCVSDFLRLIQVKDNRLVWAAMIDLALIADRKPREIFAQYGEIVKVMERGSVITRDNGIKTLARVASTSREYSEVIFPFLLEQLERCRAKSVPQYAESISVAVTPDNRDRYLGVLDERFDTLSLFQQRRVKKLLKAFGDA